MLARLATRFDRAIIWRQCCLECALFVWPWYVGARRIAEPWGTRLALDLGPLRLSVCFNFTADARHD